MTKKSKEFNDSSRYTVKTVITQKDIIAKLKINKKLPDKNFIPLQLCAKRLERTQSVLLYALGTNKISLDHCYAYQANKTARVKLYVNYKAFEQHFSHIATKEPIDTNVECEIDENGEPIVFDDLGIASRPVTDLQTAKYRSEVLKIRQHYLALQVSKNEVIPRDVLKDATIELANELKSLISSTVVVAAPRVLGAKNVLRIREIFLDEFTKQTEKCIARLQDSLLQIIDGEYNDSNDNGDNKIIDSSGTKSLSE